MGPLNRVLASSLVYLVAVLSCSVSSGQSEDPHLLILGVVQDAGYPQIGCYAEHCMPGWENPALRRGATSIALVAPKSESNILFEATPNLPEQLYQLR